MKIQSLCLLAALAFVAYSNPVLPSPALAQSSAYASRPPLMVIRFNQRNVYFEKPLYSIVTKAVAAKQDVMFDVVGLRPAGSRQDDEKLNRVVAAMQRMGVPASRMTIESAEQAGISSQEVHIFVR